MKTTIIIPNYNGLSFMEPCFEALDRQTTKDFKILVVDNGSTDGSVEWLKEKKIPSIFLPENTGFSGAVNVGIKAADTPYVILLNNDTKVAPHYVEALERAMDRSEKIFSVSSKMIQMYHPDLMDDAGDMYSVLGWAFQRGVDVRKVFIKKAAACLRPVPARRSTAGKCLRRSDTSMRCTSRTLRISMWDIVRSFTDMTMCSVRKRWCTMWEAGPAVPSIILSR